MRSLITFTLSFGLLTACGDKEEEDTAVEVSEETEETTEEDTSVSEETEEVESEGEE